MSAFPYDLATLLGGAVRAVYEPGSGTIPADPEDIFDQSDPYAVNGSWLDFGATRDAASYSTGVEKSGSEIQQVSGVVLEEVTNISHSFTISMANLSQATIKIIENSQSTGTVAAVGGTMRSYEEVNIGNFTELDRYRMAFIARRSKKGGVVTEPGGATRGRFVVVYLHAVEISADERSFEYEKGNLVAANVTFTAFPDETRPTNEEWGQHWLETAGTI